MIEERIFISFALGFLVGLNLILWSNFIPKTEFTFVIISLLSPERGTRLYIGGIHIHHYIIGIVISLISIPFYFMKKYSIFGFLLGLGIFLIIDQIPNIMMGTW